jgi:hypothetical protein
MDNKFGFFHPISALDDNTARLNSLLYDFMSTAYGEFESDAYALGAMQRALINCCAELPEASQKALVEHFRNELNELKEIA